VNPDNTPGNSTRDEETGKFVPTNSITGTELGSQKTGITEQRNKAIAIFEWRNHNPPFIAK